VTHQDLTNTNHAKDRKLKKTGKNTKNNQKHCLQNDSEKIFTKPLGSLQLHMIQSAAQLGGASGGEFIWEYLSIAVGISLRTKIQPSTNCTISRPRNFCAFGPN
jgi:hypothetical protein